LGSRLGASRASPPAWGRKTICNDTFSREVSNEPPTRECHWPDSRHARPSVYRVRPARPHSTQAAPPAPRRSGFPTGTSPNRLCPRPGASEALSTDSKACDRRKLPVRLQSGVSVRVLCPSISRVVPANLTSAIEPRRLGRATCATGNRRRRLQSLATQHSHSHVKGDVRQQSTASTAEVKDVV